MTKKVSDLQAGDSPRYPANPGLITLSVMLATIMQAVDTTIANIALPHMQGAMGATEDQISWVLTSYVLAAAIFMPLTGFLAQKLGRKRIFLLSVAGFTVTSMLCGAAQNLEEVVLFRFLQGMFGASLVPLSQAVMLDSYPPEKFRSAMAMWGVGIMVGPVIGPTLGGWLTEFYNWRWVFYINLPFGILALLGLWFFVPETRRDSSRRFDWAGFAFLSIAIAAFQLMMDRGTSKSWFDSTEILLECVVAILCFYLFLVHILSTRSPYIEPAMFRDRNFSVGLVFMFMVGIILLSTMALLPPFMQVLMGYPVIDVGNLLAPRGAGTMLSMFLVGRSFKQFSEHSLIILGLLLTALSLWQMSGFTLEVSGSAIVVSGFVQGLGLGFIFVPLSTIAFSTLPERHRNEATSLYSLVRSFGSSVGVSIVFTMLARHIQSNRAVFSEQVNRFNEALQFEPGLFDINSHQGVLLLNGEVNRQAMQLAYLQDFRLMMWITLAAIPIVFLMKSPEGEGETSQ